MGSASWGLVPHVTVGAMPAPSSRTSRSKAAPASLGSERQYAVAAVHASPRGA